MSRDQAHTGPAWRTRAEALVVVSAAVLLLSGALAAIHVRPYSHRPPAHVGLAVAAVAALRGTHRVAAWTVVASAVAAALLGRRWPRGARRPWSPSRGGTAAFFVVLATFLATGLVTPWDSLLPWSLPLGGNMARPMPLLGNEGPFPELVGVNVAYDDSVRAIGRLRLGPRGAGRLYLAHVVALPLGAAVALVVAARRRARSVALPHA